MSALDLDEAARVQHAIWNDLVGDAWVRHAHLHDRQAEPFGVATMAAIGPIAGAAVLDVGCGTAATSIELSERGAREVHGVDISVPMINAARTGHHPANVTFTDTDVLALEPQGHYDVIFSRFGLMFFADPAAGFAHLRRLATDTARLGFCCWGPVADNPWMSLPAMATVPVLGPLQLAGPGEPGPFSLSSPEVITHLLGHGGWTDIAVEPLTIDQPHPAGDASDVARVLVEFSPPIAQGLKHQPDRIAVVRAALTDALRPLERAGSVRFQASALIVTARA